MGRFGIPGPSRFAGLVRARRQPLERRRGKTIRAGLDPGNDSRRNMTEPHGGEAQPATGGHRIAPRSPQFRFPRGIDKHWLGGSVFRTHWLNSYTLIIPDGEKFIARTTKRYVDRVDPELRERLLGLLGQEISHSREHEKFFDNLTEQGYRIGGFVSAYKFAMYSVLEKLISSLMGRKLLLSTAAAIEHFNAVIAEVGLTNGFLDEADPGVRPLFEWHYAEEIEHKAVVFDVLRQVAPSYPVRAIGVVFATCTFMGALLIGTMVLVAQDRKLFDRECLRDAAQLFFSKERFVPKLLVAFRDYLRRGFHPDQHDSYPLAWEVFERLGVRFGRSI